MGREGSLHVEADASAPSLEPTAPPADPDLWRALDRSGPTASRPAAGPEEAEPAPEARRRRRRARSTAVRGLVEFVRLIMVALGAVGGWEIAASTAGDRSSRLLVGIVLGSAVGYVLGGVFGRTTATAVSEFERELERMPAADLLASVVGLLAGVATAALVSIPLFHLPPVAAYATVAFAYASFGYTGSRVGRAKSEEIFLLFGIKPRAAGHRPGEVSILDSSALLDGRILALVRLGFLSGTMLLTQGVLEELQAVGDSSNPNRRTRGRKALELVMTLKRDPRIDVVLVREPGEQQGEPVDARLVHLARDRGGVLITNDAGLAKVAAAVDVPVRSIHALAEAMRPSVAAGERVELRLIRPGREAGQAVGYLPDGTMTVVEDAAGHLGETVAVGVTNTIQTSTGRLVFGRLAED